MSGAGPDRPRRGRLPRRLPRPRRRAPVGAALRAALALAAGAAAVGCLDVGEPTPAPARVAWAAYPDTVVVGETFSFELAGPVSLNSCGRLDTARVAVGDSAIGLSAERSLFLEAMCSDERISFYQVRPLAVERPGRYPVRSADGRDLGTLVALDSGGFSPVRTRGWGTLREGGGCLFFGPGWAANQRPFALRGAPEDLRRTAGTDTLVWVRGTLVGFSLCGGFGSRPAIRVEAGRVTDSTGRDWYPGDPPDGATEDG